MGCVKYLGYFLSALVVLTMSCTAAKAQEDKYALKGILVTPDQVIANGTLLVVGEKIQAIGADITIPPHTKVIDTKGIILPGLIDLHNHLTWNLLPRWKANREFANRYDWQQLVGYSIALATPHYELTREKLGCAMNRYAEIKAITEGETSVVGSLGPEKCIEGLARNLDFYSGFYAAGVLEKEKLRNEVFPLELDNSTVSQIIEALDKKELTAFLAHLSEGKPDDASAAREFRMFVARGFLRPGVSIIHGAALKQADFHQLAQAKVGLIWSPRSNIELYGSTTDVAAALAENVKIALSPDWSPTGSDGMLEELRYAANWNAGRPTPVFSNKELVRMATQYPAQLAGLEDKIGSLAAGFYADVLVLRSNQQDAYSSIVHAAPSDVELVIIGGEPVYGNPELMKELLPKDKGQLENLTVCKVRQALGFESEARLQGVIPEAWNHMRDRLDEGLQEWGTHLAPLDECPN
jgi:5-methylthioadenosine/S-adenosylhomocysteine deaminase